MELTPFGLGDTAIFKALGEVGVYVYLPVEEGQITIEAICVALTSEGYDLDRFSALLAELSGVER